MVSPFAGRSHFLAHYCSFRPEPVCDANLQTVTDPCLFRNLTQAVVIEEQVLTEVTDQPILLSQTQGVKRYTFTEVVDFRVRKIITVAQSDLLPRKRRY